MCTRFAQLRDPSVLAAFAKASALPNYPFNPNVAPTEDSPVITLSEGPRPQTMLRLARFGLIPHWARDESSGPRLCNARAETVAEKNAFREAFAHRRCLVPVAGFYEWRTEGSIKQPYFFSRADQTPLMLAGLWEYWEKEGQSLYSFTIITTDANADVAPYHHRMPVILSGETMSDWLREGGSAALLSYQRTLDVKAMNPAMNNPRLKEWDIIAQGPNQASLF